MKLLITSDVHGDFDGLREVIEKHKDVDYHINAGDMCIEAKRYERFHIITVKGNNDFGVHLPWFRILDLDGLKILLTHGHMEFVKFGFDRLKQKAKLMEANLVIFGHTHERYLMKDEEMMLINPGALGDYHRSYAIYENGQVTFYQR